MNEDLLQYRNRIDELDKEIIDCIQERAKLAGKIGEVKRPGESLSIVRTEKEKYTGK